MFPSFANSKQAAKIPAVPVFFKFFEDLKLDGINSEISFDHVEVLSRKSSKLIHINYIKWR